MRVAKPDELKSAAVPIMTARVSEGELSRWFPFEMEHITDPDATPEPSRGALLKLTSGPHFVLFWGEESNQLTVQIPSASDPSAFLAAFFNEVPLPKTRVLWHREDVQLPKRLHALAARTTSAAARLRARGSRGRDSAARKTPRLASRRVLARKK